MAIYFGGSGTTDLAIAANFTYFFKATCTADGNVTDGRMYYISGSGNIKLAVYADSAGTPGALLGESGVIVMAGGGPFTATTTYASPFAVTNGTFYWLAWLSNFGPHLGSDNPGTDTFYFLAATYPTFPASGSGATASGTNRGSVEAGVSAAGAAFVPQIVIM